MNGGKEKNYGLMTKALHCGWKCDPATGASGLPIYATAAYQFRDAEHAANLFSLNENGFIYSRLSNPTVMAFEQGLNALEGGVGCLATSSGQAAFVHLLTALCSAGDHVVASKKLYGGTLTLLGDIFTRFGITTTFVDTDHPCQVEQAIRDETKAIITEIIGNPLMNVAPLETLGRLATRHGVPLVIDNTFASPALCRPLEWGAHIVVHSTSKYISGNGSLIGGAVVDGGSFDWNAWPDKFPGLTRPDKNYHDIVFTEKFGKAALYAKLHVSIIRDLGGCPSAFDGWLLHLSLATLPLRMERVSANALAVARFLENHPQVEWVLYPGLESHPHNDLAKIYLKEGCGGMIAFSVKGGLEAGRRFLNSVSLIGHMANVGDCRTLVVHPASTTHSQMTPEQRAEIEIGEGLIRLSTGLEDVADIIADLEQALAVAAG